jgi:hypothetical protein
MASYGPKMRGTGGPDNHVKSFNRQI